MTKLGCRALIAAVLVIGGARVVHAQPAAPKAPAIPSALPAAPAVPPVAAPAAPSASAPAAPAPSTPPPATAPPSTAPAAATPAPSEVRDADVILLDDKAKTEEREDGVPPTLPRELQRNVPANSRVRVQDRSGAPLTIEEITNPLVVSASKRAEGALSAPSWVLVITAKDIRDRGYTELSQVLDDLPGMDVVRPYGDVYVRSYWRGYRPDAGSDPFLIMMDGVVFNSLFFKDTQILATFPLTNIERVEVVYGPASAVYGPNAAIGVINVITKDGSQRQENGELGVTSETRVTFGGPQHNFSHFEDMTKIVDSTVHYTAKDWRVRLSTRLENSSLDTSVADHFEYTKNKYYADPRIWGAPVLSQYSSIAGRFHSPDQKRAFDARVYLGAGTEIAAQYFQLSTGLGTRYPADQYQTQTPWTTSELSIYAAHTAKLSESVVSKSFVQYRQSNVDSPSQSLGRPRDASGAFSDIGPSYYSVSAPNSGVTFQEDLDLAVARNLFMENDQVTANAGFRYQHQWLSRNYVFSDQTTFPLTAADPIGGARSDATVAPQSANSQIAVDTVGPYLLAKYLFAGTHALNLGGRLDYSTLFGRFYGTLRGGYVGTFDKLTLKVLYGQSVDDPPPLITTRAGEQLRPELSQTLEGSVNYTIWKLAFMGDLYYVTYSNPIIGETNLQVRRSMGTDLGVQFLAQPFHLWAYYSRYFVAEGSSLTGTGTVRTGDLAFDKVWGGATYDKGPFTATLLGRFIGPRQPVDTNPLGTVPSYFVLDANVRISHVAFDGLWFAFRAGNLLDSRYSQPGQGTADSGNTPGIFSGTTYTGSRGFYNSRLPQPGRTLLLTIGLDT